MLRFALLIFIALWCFSCQNGVLLVKELETPKSITNYLTEKYQDFPGTKLSILVPEGFRTDQTIAGFRYAAHTSNIIASRVDAKPLLAAGLYKARLFDKTRSDALDATFLDDWNIVINNWPSRLFKVQAEYEGDVYLQYILFTGDSISAYRVIGNIHEDDVQIAPAVKQSLLSTFFDPERQIVSAGQSPTQTSASPCNCPK